MTYTAEADTPPRVRNQRAHCAGCSSNDAHLLSNSLVAAELWGHSPMGCPGSPGMWERSQRRDGHRHPK